MAIGSGGGYARAAASALLNIPRCSKDIVSKSLAIAADICVYTNQNHTRKPLRVKAVRQRMSTMAPREIVHELNNHIVGQDQAKRSVAIALRNRWRRMQLNEELQEEIHPKNILTIGPTGVGKTEIARRLAKLAKALSLKLKPPNLLNRIRRKRCRIYDSGFSRNRYKTSKRKTFYW